jgi:hypothetical protein
VRSGGLSHSGALNFPVACGALVAGLFDIPPAQSLFVMENDKKAGGEDSVRVNAFCSSGREIRVFAEMQVSGPGEYCGIVKLFMSLHQSFGKAAWHGHHSTNASQPLPEKYIRPKAEDTAHVKCDRPLAPPLHGSAWTSTCGLIQRGQRMVMTSRQVTLMTRPGESKSLLVPIIIRYYQGDADLA